MTVAELIEVLQKMPQDAVVKIHKSPIQGMLHIWRLVHWDDLDFVEIQMEDD